MTAGGILAMALLLVMGLASQLRAQNLLYVEEGQKLCLVRSARGTEPYIKVDGRLIPASGDRFALKKTEEFLPMFISVRDVEVWTTYLHFKESAINNEFHFKAKFETPYRLDDVFIVLDLDTESAGKVLFLHEIGRLEPRDPKPVSLDVPMTSKIGPGHYQFHLFVGGVEVLHSGIPFGEREAALDRMVAKRIAGVQDAPLQVFVGPNPDYPAALLKAKTKGQALVSLRVDPRGRVLEPAVKSATDPAFGEAALAAVRLWRFLPRVESGRPVETTVEMPFDFTPSE